MNVLSPETEENTMLSTQEPVAKTNVQPQQAKAAKSPKAAIAANRQTNFFNALTQVVLKQKRNRLANSK